MTLLTLKLMVRREALCASLLLLPLLRALFPAQRVRKVSQKVSKRGVKQVSKGVPRRSNIEKDTQGRYIRGRLPLD